MSSRTKNIFIGRERNTSVSFEFSSQSDVKLFEYYQLYCRIFVTTTTKPTIVYASNAYVHMNSVYRVRLTQRNVSMKKRQTDRKTYIYERMYVYETTDPFFEEEEKRRERVHADVRFCKYIFTLTCVCLPI